MAKKCVITGKQCSFGNNVSHANNHTRCKFSANLFKHRFYVPEVKKFLKINVSAAGIRNIAKLGVFNALKKGYGK